MKIIVILLIGIISLIIYNKSKNKNSFFKELTDTYPKYTILKKIDTYMICDCNNHRKEPEELVIVRFNPKRKKIMYKKENRIIAVYPKEPKIKEFKADLKKYISL